MSNKIIDIQSSMASDFRKLLEKFNTKATKHGMEKFKVESVKAISKTIDGNLHEFFRFVMSQPKFALGDFEVKAVFTNDAESDLVFTFNGYEHDHTATIDYRQCDHCNVRHARKTVILIEDDGDFKQVGKSCIKDFTGVSLSTFNWFQDTFNKISDINEWNDPSSLTASEVIGVTNVLASAYDTCSKYGYHKVDSDTPTAVDVLTIIGDGVMPSSEGIAWADDAIEMIKHMIPTSNYEQNIYNIIKTGHVSHKRIGLLASAYVMVEMEKRKNEKIEDAENVSEYVGELKERITFEGTIKLAYGMDSYYGYKVMYIIEDDDGNQFKWVATSPKHHGHETGKTFSITGTVSDHDEYKNVKQTILKRCKVEEKI